MARIITRGVIDWSTLAIEECESFEYSGPITQCKDAGSPPQAVDPYTQAAAQYGLSTGTALFNAGLNRTNSQNPAGSSTWSASYPGSSYQPGQTINPNNLPPGWNYAPGQAPQTGGGMVGPSASGPGATLSNGVPAGSTFGGSSGIPYSLGGSGVPIRPGGSAGAPYNGSPTGSPSGGAPTYTQTTSLTPWANDMLSKPIDTSGLAGMPGGPSTTEDLQNTQDALYKSQMQYLQPEQDLESEQLQSKLANQGIMPGSEAYKNEMDRLNREQTFQTSNARTQAITGAGAEQSRLFGLGTQGLQNQLTVRDAPIREYQSLAGNGGAAASAQTPDISGAFGQQLNSQLAGYNAQVASNNATTQDVTSLAALAAMYFMM